MRCLGSRTGGSARAAAESASSCTSCVTSELLCVHRGDCDQDGSCWDDLGVPMGVEDSKAEQKARKGVRGAAMWGSSEAGDIGSC